MSSILHPIHGIQQSCRPKHQVLVLKCYPKFQKNVQDVKASSSELSYLLYYTSSRRSKLQKVGAFLEKKTASDVWRNKLGNVQVTLQILTAIIEKTPRDLSLYSTSILTILNTVLQSKDINMVEESIPTFEAYCKHIDESSLTADQHRAQQYLAVVELYSTFASTSQVDKDRVGESVPISLRWRTAGLRAIRAAVGSDALAADSAKQLGVVMPVILENLSLEKHNVLTSLQHRAQAGEKLDVEVARRRRMSSATVTTMDTNMGDLVTATETTADADKAAEEEVRVMALRCLKQIFSVGIGSTRGQTRLATALTLRFIATKNPPRAPVDGIQTGNWATSLFEAIARWTPVQDRFIIVVTAMEALVRSPIIESVLEKQLVLATMIDWLLSSTINLIGLSVMDVLLGFIHHTLLLLQLGGRDSKVSPHHQQTDTLGLYRETKETFDPSSVLAQPERGRDKITTEKTPSPIRQELLSRLQKCIASLSNHIYYTDQITDMMTAILARLKPSLQSEISTTTAAINNPAAATKAIAESASLQEDPSTDSFFSFATARVTALKAIKDILIRANNRRTATGAAIEARSRVGVQVWEGTQWLLKDEDREVRMAYVDAILIWVKLETNKSDMLLPRASQRKPKPGKKVIGQNGEVSVAKRAISNASRKESKPARSTFLQLLHLAIYDSIIERSDAQSDVLTLYLLLTKLVERLGVNALRTGLPMIFRLQETVLNGEIPMSSEAKLHVASLIHGYLWSIAEKFDFEGSKTGHEINAEISRRKRFSVWFDRIKFPAVSIDGIDSTMVKSEKTSVYSEDSIETLRPFLSISELVSEIAEAYDNALLTPPTSPPSSPGRVFSVPTLGFGYGYGVAPGPKPSPEDQLPQRVKDELTSGWSREACIAAVEKESTASMTGSRTGASSGPRHLHVNGMHRNGSLSGRESPNIPGQEPAPAFGLFSGLGNLPKQRRSSANGSPGGPLTSTSSRDSTMRVTDLKRALSGYGSNMRQPSPLRQPFTGSRRGTQSTGSESMISWNEAEGREASNANFQSGSGGSQSNFAAAPSADAIPRPGTSSSTAKDFQTSSTNPTTSTSQTYHDQSTLPHSKSDPRLGEDVPPVPRIPSTLNLPGTYPRDASPPRPETAIATSSPLKLEKTRSRASASGLVEEDSLTGTGAKTGTGAGTGTSPERLSKRITSASTAASPSNRDNKDGRPLTGGGNRSSRPTSRMAGSNTGWNERRMMTTGAEKIDVGSLLAGIKVGGRGSDAGFGVGNGVSEVKENVGGGRSASEEGVSAGGGLSRPPY